MATRWRYGVAMTTMEQPQNQSEPEEPDLVRISLRWPPEMRDAIQQRANTNRRSLNAELLTIIEEVVARDLRRNYPRPGLRCQACDGAPKEGTYCSACGAHGSED